MSAVLAGPASALAWPAALAQQAPEPVVSTGEAIAFWILAPLALAGALGMVFARNAVHSALWLVLAMLTLGVFYLLQNAAFLGFTQIIVYTGAVMMLFLFVLMMAGRDSSEALIEVIRGQRLAAAAAGVGFAVLLSAALTRSLTDVTAAAPLDPASPEGGGAGGLGRLILTDYLFPFELTAVLLIVAALAGIVLAQRDKREDGPRRTQREQVEARFRGQYQRPSPKPGPGVFATGNSVATPALLPDGTIARESLSDLIEATATARLVTERRDLRALGSTEDDVTEAGTLRSNPPPGSEGHQPGPDQQHGPGQPGPDQHGPDQPGPDQQGPDQHGRGERA